MSHNINRLFLAFIIAVVAVFLVLILYSSSDFGGADQYWYIDDVQTLITPGPNVTNSIFPPQLMAAESPNQSPFIHNILSLYLVVPAAFLFGTYVGWIITNTIATLLSAAIIAWIVYKCADLWTAGFAFAAYLLMPLTIWATPQPLAEPTIAMLTALGALVYVYTDSQKYKWLLLFLAAAACYLSRVSFLPALFVIPLAYLVRYRSAKPSTIAFTVALLFFALVITYTKKFIFPASVTANLTQIVYVSIPGLTDSMHWYFCLSPIPIEPRQILLKFLHYFYRQFMPGLYQLQVFHLPFNFLTALSVYLCVKAKSSFSKKLAACAVFLFLLHLATIMLVQLQFRYMLVVTPPIAASGFVGLYHFRRFLNKKLFFAAMTVGLIVFCACDSYIAMKTRQQGITQRQMRIELKDAFEDIISPGDSVIIEHAIELQIFSHTLKPRPTVFVRTNYPPEILNQIKQKCDAKWLICLPDSQLLQSFDISADPVLENLRTPNGTYCLYSL